MDALKNDKHEAFCQEYVVNGLNASAAYVKVGYKKAGCDANSSRLMQKDSIRARIDSLLHVITAEVIRVEVTNRNSRLTALQDIANRLRTVMDERGSSAEMQNVPGGKTGLLVRQVRMAGKVQMDEYKVDAATVREFRETLIHAAKEVGQWSEKSEVTWSWDGDISKLTPEQREKLMQHFAMAAFPGDPAALEKAKAEVERGVVQ